MAVVVPYIAAQDPLEVRRTHDQQVVEAFRSDRSHETLGVCVRVRGPKRRAQNPSTSAGEDGVEAFDVLGISVTEEELGLDPLVFEVAGDVPRLLGDPSP